MFRTQTDTEVLVHGYEEYGISFVEQLNGMFAAAIWDKKKKALYLFRDRSGIKPLYVSECREGLFWIGNEGSFQHPDIKLLLSRRLFLVIYPSVIRSESRLFSRNSKITPGVILRIDETGITKEAYWQYPLPADGIDQGRTLLSKGIV